MSSFELLAPRKNWSDLVVKSIDSNTIVAGIDASVIQLDLGSLTNSGGGTINLTADQVVGGLFAFVNTTAAHLPSATDIQNFIGTLPPEITFYRFTFKTYVETGTITFTPGTGTTTYDGVATFQYTTGGSRDITYALTPLGWKIYY